MEFERVNLFVQTVDGKKTQVELDRYATIAHLKEAIRNETGHAVMDQKLMLYGNFELYNCWYYHFTRRCHLDMVTENTRQLIMIGIKPKPWHPMT